MEYKDLGLLPLKEVIELLQSKNLPPSRRKILLKQKPEPEASPTESVVTNEKGER